MRIKRAHFKAYEITVKNKQNIERRMDSNEIKISGSRLYLKPFSSIDAEEAFQCITPTLTQYMSWEPPENRDIFKQIWSKWLLTIEDETDLVFVIRDVIDHDFLGLIALHQTQSKTPEFGIWIREDRHHLGFGREALKLLLNWASSHFHYEHFVYPVAVENKPSRKLAESLGGVIQYYQKKPKYESVTYAIPVLVNSY